jgi:hypothetical protein
LKTNIRPDGIFIKDEIVKKVAGALGIDEKVVDRVVRHEYSTAFDALLTNKSVEFPGMGKFVFSGPKARRKIKRLLIYESKCREDLEGPLITEKQRGNFMIRLKYLEDMILALKSRMDDFRNI